MGNGHLGGSNVGVHIGGNGGSGGVGDDLDMVKVGLDGLNGTGSCNENGLSHLVGLSHGGGKG